MFSLKLPCDTCRQNRSSSYFCPLENEFIDTFTDDRYCQTCHECLARKFGRLNCTECLGFFPESSFSAAEKAKGIERVCKTCEKVPEGQRDSEFLFKNKLMCRTCEMKGEACDLKKCANCQRVYYCSKEVTSFSCTKTRQGRKLTRVFVPVLKKVSEKGLEGKT
jgi:hypothetical protein